jgi:hypothetical protein
LTHGRNPGREAPLADPASEDPVSRVWQRKSARIDNRGHLRRGQPGIHGAQCPCALMPLCATVLTHLADSLKGVSCSFWAVVMEPRALRTHR